MSAEETTESAPAPAYHRDRPSARTPEERQAHFEHWLSGMKPYDAAVIANGGTPPSDDERRELFMRRYQKPAAPKYLTIPNLKETA